MEIDQRGMSISWFKNYPIKALGLISYHGLMINIWIIRDMNDIKKNWPVSSPK